MSTTEAKCVHDVGRVTYRIFVLNSTAIVCAIVLSLLTNSMPASRATAITRSLSVSR